MSRFIIDKAPDAKYEFDDGVIARKHKIIMGDVVSYRIGQNAEMRYIYYCQLDGKLELRSQHGGVTFGLDVTAKYPNVKQQFAQMFDYFSMNQFDTLCISFLASDEGFEDLNLDKRCYSYEVKMRYDWTTVSVKLVPDSWMRKRCQVKTTCFATVPEMRWASESLKSAMCVLNKRIDQYVSDDETCLCIVNTNANGFNSIAKECVCFYSDCTFTVSVGTTFVSTIQCLGSNVAYFFFVKPKEVERFRQSVVDVCGSGLLAFYRSGPKRRLFVLQSEHALFYPTEHDMSPLSPCMMHPEIVELSIIFSIFNVYELLAILEQIPTLNFVPRHTQSKIITSVFNSIRKIKSMRLA